jgi:2-polyprenyl-6-methoxyphenol hydroxylase-like FAD-dependent oxidoreductase
MNSTTQAVTIVGGGIAGLALAARLDPTRFDVTVHEQRGELPTVGTLLAMWPGAQRALAALGLLDDLTAQGVTLGVMELRNAEGQVLAAGPDPQFVGVSRIDLLRALDSAVPASVRRLTSRVTDVPTDADLVVGADGVHSVVRRSTWGARSAAVPSPYLAVRGVLDRPPDADTAGEYWGRGDLFGIGPSAGGRTNWYASFRSSAGPVGISVPDALALAATRYAGRAPAIAQVLDDASAGRSLAQRVWTTPVLRSYVRGRTALVGDAAHAMMPNLGRGACEALVDAITLADLLNAQSLDAQPLPAALAAYDRARVLRTQALRVGSSALMRLALVERAQPVRDRLIAVAGRRSRAAVRPHASTRARTD